MLKQILGYRFIATTNLMLLALSTSCSKMTESRESVKPLSRQSPEWTKLVSDKVLKLGESSWVIIGNPAFPAFNQKEIEAITVDVSSPEVLEQVLSALEKNGHVEAKIYISKEGRFLKETESPEYKKFQTMRNLAANDSKIRALDHIALEILLMDAKKNYSILMIKTNTSLPYSSVFLELESKY